MKKYIFLFLFLLVNSVNAQRIISHENGITFNTGSSNVAIGGNLTVATNVTAGGQVLVPEGWSSSPSYSFSDDTNTGFWSPNSDQVYLSLGGAINTKFRSDYIQVVSPMYIGGVDTMLYRDAAGILALRNGTASNVFRTYGTYTDASNYERVSLSHNGAGTAVLAAETAGTGTDDQSLKIKLSGAGALYMEGDTAGNARGAGAIDLQVYRANPGHVASGAYSTLSGGIYGTASGQSAALIGGAYNLASGQSSFVGGGNNNTASATYSSTVGGYQTSAYLQGQHAYASGPFVSKGDAQGSRLVARNTTTGTTPADLFLDGASARAILPANTSWGFTINIVGRTTDGGSGAEQSGYYEIKGLIRRDGANNTVLVGYITKTTIAEDDATWDVTASADDTNEALNINCTGGSGDTVRWVATINLTEVGG